MGAPVESSVGAADRRIESDSDERDGPMNAPRSGRSSPPEARTSGKVRSEGKRRLSGELPLREDPPAYAGEPEAEDGQVDIMDWVAPFACHDYPTGGAPSINSRASADVSVGEAAKGLELNRSSDTALEGGLVTDASLAETDEYLRPVADSGKSAPPWLQAVAKQVPQLKAWWRCVASSMGSTAASLEMRRSGLTVMLQAAVEPETEGLQRHAVDSLHEWAADWEDREGHLRKVMLA